MALLSRDAIWQADDLKTEDVPVPEWGGTVRLRGLTGAERDDFEASSFIKVKSRNGISRDLNTRNIRSRLIARCAIDESGQRLFEAADVLRLSQKSAAALERLFEVAQRLSGLTDDDVEELAGNSGPGQSEPSTSA